MIAVEECERLAVLAHGDDRNKAGSLFIDHVRRVADQVRTDPDPYAVPAALLHDTVEKGSLGWADLRTAGADDRLIAVVDALTERDGEPEADYLARCAAEPLALRIKRADINDKFDLISHADLTNDQRDKLLHRAHRRIATLESIAAAA